MARNDYAAPGATGSGAASVPAGALDGRPDPTRSSPRAQRRRTRAARECRAHVADPAGRCECGRPVADDEVMLIGDMRRGRWATAHPDRDHRARRPLPGELEAHGLAPADHPDTVIPLVRQVAPGERIRVPLRGPLPPAFVAELLDAIARGDGRGVAEMGVRPALARRGAGGRA